MGRGNSLYKTAILTDRRDFARLFEKGNRKSYKNLQLIAVPGDADELKFAVCVSVRSGNSVQRNRLKRVLRVVVLEALPHLQKGWIMAVLPRGNTSILRIQDIHDQFRFLCQQMRLLENGTHA